MSVKKRIILLVTAAGFIASLLFSGAIFYELIEQPFFILDTELKEEANRAFYIIETNQLKPGTAAPPILDEFPTWLKIFENDSDKMLWQSKIAERVILPTVEPGSAKNKYADIFDNKIDFGQGNRKKAMFRTSAFELTMGQEKFAVQVALPMVKLKEEIQDLLLSILAGLVFSTLCLILISYFVAGRVLKPIGEMKDLAHNISIKNLAQRIPVGNEKDEFNELARTINMMLDRLQYAFMKQRDFLFDTSHELKTPLTTIRLAIDEICSDKEMTTLQPFFRGSLLRVKQQTARMERLVKDLLNLSALELMNRIEPKTVHLSDILRNLIYDYRFIADGKDIKIETNITEGIIIQGDEEKIRRVFSNIIDNAIKYNEDRGSIEITAKGSNDEIIISVTNTGPGIPEDEIPKIFDQFYRVEKSRSTDQGGSGLGLAIVKRIIELHGGRIELSSQYGKRTRVHVMLPRYPKNQP